MKEDKKILAHASRERENCLANIFYHLKRYKTILFQCFLVLIIVLQSCLIIYISSMYYVKKCEIEQLEKKLEIRMEVRR